MSILRRRTSSIGEGIVKWRTKDVLIGVHGELGGLITKANRCREHNRIVLVASRRA